MITVLYSMLHLLYDYSPVFCVTPFSCIITVLYSMLHLLYDYSPVFYVTPLVWLQSCILHYTFLLYDYSSVFYVTPFSCTITVLYSTLLAQAQNEDEKNEIEQKMESEPELKQILNALQATDKEDIVTEERARRQQDRRSRVAADIAAMDMDDNQVSTYGHIWSDCDLFLIQRFKHRFWVLKRTISLRWFFWILTTYVFTFNWERRKIILNYELISGDLGSNLGHLQLYIEINALFCCSVINIYAFRNHCKWNLFLKKISP